MDNMELSTQEVDNDQKRVLDISNSLFFQSKCAFFAPGIQERWGPIHEYSMVFNNIEDCKDYFLYEAVAPLRLQTTVKFDYTIMRELTCVDVKKLRQLSNEEKIAIYWGLQQNKQLLADFDKASKRKNFLRTINVDIEYDVDVLDWNYIAFGSWNLTLIPITNELLTNATTRKILQRILIFELSHRMQRLSIYDNVSSQKHIDYDLDIAIFDRYISIKILAQLLLYFNISGLDVFLRKIIDRSYWPTVNDYKYLYNLGVSMSENIRIIPFYDKGGMLCYPRTEKVLFHPPLAHYESLLWNTAMINKLCKFTNVKEFVPYSDESSNIIHFFITGKKKNYLLSNIHTKSTTDTFCVYQGKKYLL